MIQDARCLSCNTLLKIDETATIGRTDDYTFQLFHRGHCPKCDKHYEWKSIFNYRHYISLRETGK